ncbi:hypothetical protein O9992_20040 [Vibrio lentus]|nr:hypothetical protein [Vibrio lentus]
MADNHLSRACTFYFLFTASWHHLLGIGSAFGVCIGLFCCDTQLRLSRVE